MWDFGVRRFSINNRVIRNMNKRMNGLAFTIATCVYCTRGVCINNTVKSFLLALLRLRVYIKCKKKYNNNKQRQREKVHNTYIRNPWEVCFYVVPTQWKLGALVGDTSTS